MAASTVAAWPVWLTLAAGLGTLFLLHYLIGYWDKPGARWFVLTLVGQAVFCFAYAAGLVTFAPALRWGLEVLACIGLSWLGVPFLGFALEYTGRGRLLASRSYWSLYAIPLSATVLLPLNPWHELFWSGFALDPIGGLATVSYTFEPLAFVIILGSLAAAGIATLLLVDTVLSYGPLYRSEALAVALSPLPPAVGLFPWLLGFGPAPQLNTVAVFLLPHVVLDAYAFVGSGMFEFHPATARAAERSAFEDLRSPVFVLDETGRVVQLNAAAEGVLGVDAETATTQPVSAVLGADIDLEAGNRRLSLAGDGRPLEFRLEPTPLADSGGNHVGYTLLFQDVTEEVRREERLSVLNRVLRHNLRNDLTAIRGFVGEATRRSDADEVTDMLARADATIADLARTGETAREIEKTVEAGDAFRTPVDLGAVLSDVADRVRSRFPEATVSVAGSEGVRLSTNPDVLEAVLGQLVENAAEHGEAPAVTVTVEDAEPDRLHVTVSDDGPGIPEHELESLRSGEETALEHGSGLGLWLVRWGTMRLGGDVSFQTGPEGTEVRLTLPEPEPDPDSPAGETGVVRADGTAPDDG